MDWGTVYELFIKYGFVVGMMIVIICWVLALIVMTILEAEMKKFHKDMKKFAKSLRRK